MSMGRRARLLLMGVAAAAALTGCNRATGDAVDDAALEAIDAAVAADLNAVPAAIVQLMKSLDRPTPIALDSFQIALDQTSTPIDFWLVRRQLVVPIVPPPAPGRPTFLISGTGSQLASQSPAWFTAAAGQPSRVDCHSANVQAAGGCEVDVTVSVQLTEAGAAAAGSPVMEPVKVHAIVARDGDGWQVRDLRTEGGGLHQYAFTTLLGAEKTRAAERQRVLTELDLKSGMANADALAASTFGAPPIGPDIGAAPLETPPVPPVIGESPYAPRRPPPPK
jgi:hypothetical protein